MSEILQKPHDFFYNLSSEFEKAIGTLCCKKSKESVFEDYLAKFMFADAVLSLSLAFYFIPLNRLGQSLERNYRHDKE